MLFVQFDMPQLGSPAPDDAYPPPVGEAWEEWAWDLVQAPAESVDDELYQKRPEDHGGDAQRRGRNDMFDDHDVLYKLFSLLGDVQQASMHIISGHCEQGIQPPPGQTRVVLASVGFMNIVVHCGFREGGGPEWVRNAGRGFRPRRIRRSPGDATPEEVREQNQEDKRIRGNEASE